MKNTENNGVYAFVKDENGQKKLLDKGIKVCFSIDDDEKEFAFIKLPPPDEEIFSNPVSKPHISIYPKKNDRKKGLSTYHYTANLKRYNKELNINQEFTAHVYFDSLGNDIEVLVKDDVCELSEQEEKMLTNFAKRTAGQTLSILIKTKEDEMKKVENSFYKQEKKISEIHEKFKFIFKDEETAQNTVQDFKKALKSCLLSLEKFNAFSEGKKRGEEKILNGMLSEADNMTLNIKQKIKNKILEKEPDTENKDSEKKPPSEEKIKPKKILKKQKIKLKKIMDLEKSDKIEDIMELYKLLDERFKKTSSEQHIELLSYYQKMNNCLQKATEKLFEIIKKNKLDILKNLLKECPDIEIPFHYYYEIVAQGNIDMLDYLLKQRTINLDHYGLNLDGDTLLYCALRNEKFKMVKYLLEKGANSDMPNLQTGTSPLFFLLILYHQNKLNDDKKLLTLFLNYYANPNLKAHSSSFSFMKEKNTSLFIMNTEIKENLLDKVNPTVFMLSILHEDLEIIELLMSKSKIPLDLSIKNKNGFTTIGLAASAEFKYDLEKRKKILLLLLKRGCNIDEIQGKGAYQCSPLYLACQFQKPDMVKLLIELGANPNLQFSITHKNTKEIVQLSSFDIAIVKQNDEIINYLIDKVTKETLLNSFQYCGENEKLITLIKNPLLEKYKTAVDICIKSN